jgi:hypothetical protein
MVELESELDKGSTFTLWLPSILTTHRLRRVVLELIQHLGLLGLDPAASANAFARP